MKIFRLSLIIAIVLSLGYLIWRAVLSKSLVCGFVKMNPCGIKSWLSQLGIMFVVLFVVLIIIFSVLTKKRMPKFGIEKEKKKKEYIQLGALETMERKKPMKKIKI